MTTETDVIPNSGGAIFSLDREYRYRLWRYLQHPDQSRLGDDDGGTAAFIMLNPSTADAEQNDPTVRRCIGYAREWGYSELIVGNIFAVRATDPDELYDHDDPVGPRNDAHLRDIALDADLVVAAWGNHGELQDRGREVCQALDVEIHALATTDAGHPGHPLYLKGDREPEPFEYAD